jgi:hypothetical protein
MPKANNKKEVFCTSDPLNNIVFMTEAVWVDHVLTKHSDLTNKEHLVKKAVEDPDKIYKDVDFDGTFNYYYTHGDSTINTYTPMIKVSVDRESGGRVKTAYPIDKIKEKTKAEYEK